MVGSFHAIVPVSINRFPWILLAGWQAQRKERISLLSFAQLHDICMKKKITWSVK